MRPTVIAVFGRPGSGKSTLIERFRARHPSYRHEDVYHTIHPHVRPGWHFTPRLLEQAYRRLSRRAHALRSDCILEFGISHPDVSVATVAQLRRRAHVFAFVLLRNVDACYRHKRRQRGDTFNVRLLRERMHRAFPSVHEQYARRAGLRLRRLSAWRGYASIVATIERVIDG